MVDLDAGELRHRVTIQNVTKVSDNEGGFTSSWADANTIWAAIKSMRAKQIGEYRSINVEATHLIKVRGGIDIEENQRIIFGIRIFEVLTVENEKEQNVTKWIVCKEKRN